MIIGASGYLGQQLKQSLTDFTIICASSSDFSSDVIIEPTGKLRYQIPIESLDIVIYCTALTAIDDCERYPEKAWHINYEVPLGIHRQLEKFAPFSIIISSDCVFAGATEEKVTELIAPQPLSVYGKNKIKLEQAFISFGKSAIIRFPKLWGGDSGNFLGKIYDQIKRAPVSYFISNQKFCPLYILDACKAVHQICKMQMEGIFHIPGPEYLSWYDIAHQIKARIPVEGHTIHEADLYAFYPIHVRPQYLNLASDHLWVQELERKKICG